MNSQIQVIIHDVDGTLCDESGSLAAQAEAVSSVFGNDFQQTIDLFFSVHDDVAKTPSLEQHRGDIVWYLQEMARRKNIDMSEQESGELATAWKQAYLSYQATPILFTDVGPYIEAMHKYDVRNIVCSGGTKETRESLLTQLGIRDHFEAIYSSVDIGFQKQNKQFWKEVLLEIGAQPGHVAVVGNQINDDVWQPKELGMTTFLIDRQDTIKKNVGPTDIEPTFTIRSMIEIPDLLSNCLTKNKSL